MTERRSSPRPTAWSTSIPTVDSCTNGRGRALGHGSYVAAVERDLKFEEDLDGLSEFGHPLDAVDCETGYRQPIEPVMYYGTDGEFRFTDRSGGRVPTGYGDSAVVVVRDTESGTQLTRQEFDDPFQSLHFVGDRLVVTFAEDLQTMIDGGAFPASAVVLDPSTGERLDEVDVGFDLLYLG